MRRTPTILFALVVVAALTLAACGGDDNTDATGAAGGTTTTRSTAEGPDPDIGDAVGLVAEECRFLLAGAFLNPLAATVPGAAVDVDDQAQQLAAMADSAPPEIKDALETISAGWTDLAEALQGVDLTDPTSFSDPEVQAKLEGLSEVVGADFEDASTTVSEYVAANCG